MRRSLFRRFALKLYSSLGKVETAAKSIVWIVGMLLATMTVVIVLPFLSLVNQYIVLILLILFLLSGLVVFVRGAGESGPNADKDEIFPGGSAESEGMVEAGDRNILVQQWQTVVQYWASDNSVVLR